MSKEVERKFRLATMPELANGKRVNQAYLSLKSEETLKLIEEKFGNNLDLEKIKEARVRQKGEGEGAKYFFTLKSDGTLERDEYEIALSAEEYGEIWPTATEGRIEKTRYEVALSGNLVAEVDKYDGALEGLLTMEVEYDPEETNDITLSEALSALGLEMEDVTSIKSYKNKALAKLGSVEELEEQVAKEKDAARMRDLNADPSHLNQA